MRYSWLVLCCMIELLTIGSSTEQLETVVRVRDSGRHEIISPPFSNCTKPMKYVMEKAAFVDDSFWNLFFTELDLPPSCQLVVYGIKYYSGSAVPIGLSNYHNGKWTGPVISYEGYAVMIVFNSAARLNKTRTETQLQDNRQFVGFKAVYWLDNIMTKQPGIVRPSFTQQPNNKRLIKRSGVTRHSNLGGPSAPGDMSKPRSPDLGGGGAEASSWTPLNKLSSSDSCREYRCNDGRCPKSYERCLEEGCHRTLRRCRDTLLCIAHYMRCPDEPCLEGQTKCVVNDVCKFDNSSCPSDPHTCQFADGFMVVCNDGRCVPFGEDCPSDENKETSSLWYLLFLVLIPVVIILIVTFGFMISYIRKLKGNYNTQGSLQGTALHDFNQFILREPQSVAHSNTGVSLSDSANEPPRCQFEYEHPHPSPRAPATPNAPLLPYAIHSAESPSPSEDQSHSSLPNAIHPSQTTGSDPLPSYGEVMEDESKYPVLPPHYSTVSHV